MSSIQKILEHALKSTQRVERPEEVWAALVSGASTHVWGGRGREEEGEALQSHAGEVGVRNNERDLVKGHHYW